MSGGSAPARSAAALAARRRRCSAAVAAAAAAAMAGAQVEEPLADAVRSALAAAIADSAPPQPELRPTSRSGWPTCAGSAR